MQNILSDIHQYNQRLTISQVCAFFSRKGLRLTKSMVQNYVRDGLLCPPVDKRYYTPKHLANLAIIDFLKPVYEMGEIKAVIEALRDDEGIPVEIYGAYVEKVNELTAKWQACVASLESANDPLAIMAHVADLKNNVG